MARLSLLASLVVFSLSGCAQALGNQHSENLAGAYHHKNVSRRTESGNLTRRGYQYTNKRATTYGAGESACGPTYSESEFVVALAQNTFGFSYPSPYCNRPIVISYGGKTAHAKIVDACPRCAEYDPHALDLSTGLFSYFASPDIGVIPVDWSFTDVAGGGDGGNDETQKKTTTTTKHTTSTHHTTPTSTSHSTTSTQHTTSTHSTTSSTRSTTTSKTKPVSTSTSTSTTSSASATSSSGVTPPSDNTGNLQSMVEVILGLESVLEAARSA